MYKFNNPNKRIDWFYQCHANVKNFSIEEFIKKVNDAYYLNSAKLYSHRYTDDIYDAYSSFRDQIGHENHINQFNIINIGAGTGFDYRMLKELDIRFKSYYFIEPSIDMINEYKNNINANDEKKIIIKNNHFSDLVDELKNKKNKLIFINSVLHHVIYLESFLDDIKSLMEVDDILVIGHEPNNSYSRLMFLFNIAFRSIFTSALIKKIPLIKKLFKKESKNIERWNNINKQLLKENIILKEMSPLTIRRIIDYGVGHKNDWKSLNIPDKYNEGFIDVGDISSYLGKNYERIFYQTYRHLGDSNGNMIIENLNKIFRFLFKNHGTNFVSVWKKCNL